MRVPLYPRILWRVITQPDPPEWWWMAPFIIGIWLTHPEVRREAAKAEKKYGHKKED